MTSKFRKLTAECAELERRRVVAVWPEDEASRQALEQAMVCGVAHVIIVDNGSDWSLKMAERFPGLTEHILALDPTEASLAAVETVREGKADVIFKGLVNTDVLLHAVLDRQHGILEPGRVLTHITATDIPSYHKLLFFSDAAVIPYPNLEQMEAMVRYGTAICRRLGIDRPKVALIHFTEKISQKFPYTIDYVTLERRAAEGRYGQAQLAGPMDVKSACDLHSAQVKSIDSDVTGNADFLIFPALSAANTFYKTLSLFGGAQMAAIVVGAQAPIVVPSRADDKQTKFNSLALACRVGNLVGPTAERPSEANYFFNQVNNSVQTQSQNHENTRNQSGVDLNKMGRL